MRAQKLAVIQRALEGIESLPPSHRADLLDGAGELLARWANPESAAAHATARAIRDAEQLQLSFAQLLNESAK